MILQAARFILITGCLLAASPLAAQTVQQSGTITPGHAASWFTNGVIGDAGTAANGRLTSLGITANGGPSFCINSAASTAAHNSLCFATSTAAHALISLQNYLGASAQSLDFLINGTTYTFPFTIGGIVGPGSSTIGHLAVWNNTAGSLLADSTTLPALTGYISLLTSPSLSTSPTGNPTAGSLLATYSSQLLQVATGKTGNREFVSQIGMTSDIGFGSTNGNGDKVGLYVGVQAGTNSSDLWAVNFLCELKSNLNNAINNNCNETDLNNNHAHYLSLSPSVFGQINSGAGAYQSTAGMAVTGITPTIAVTGATSAAGLIRLTVNSTVTLQTGFRTNVAGVTGTTEANGIWTMTVIDGSHIDLQGSTFANAYISGGTITGPIWRYGFLLANNAVNEIGFYDFSDSKVAFAVDGAHDIGLDLRRVSFGIAPITIGNNAALAALENDNATLANILYLDNTNVTQIGGGLAVNVNSTMTVMGGIFTTKVIADQDFRVRGKLTLADGITVYSTNDANNALKGMELGASKFFFTGGDVGIANASPAYPLDVTGDVNASGTYRQGGTNVGVTCSGAPTGSFATIGGIVTHC